jgi:hypothetical protein
MTGFRYRYNSAQKPIKVVHFHPNNKKQWECMVEGINDVNAKIVNKRLVKIFEKNSLKWK